MRKQTLEEKIKLSEELVDKYLNEIAITAQGIQAGAYAVNTARDIVGDIGRFYSNKMAERKKKEEERERLSQKKQIVTKK